MARFERTLIDLKQQALSIFTEVFWVNFDRGNQQNSDCFTQNKIITMDRKKLTPKQIFRTLAFHYHLDDAIPIQLLAQMVSSLYYPINPQGQAKLKYKKILITFMKEYNNQEKIMNQEKFVKFLSDMTKHSNDEYLRKLTDRIFNRYCNRQVGVIQEEGFKRMSIAFGISPQESREYFLSVADLKNEITKQKFQDYMSALVTPKRF